MVVDVSSALDRRSNRLGRALLALGVLPRDHVAISCCPEHAGDEEVALAAVRKAGARAEAILPERLAELLAAGQPRLLLACCEGVAAWRASGVPCTVVGDDTGVTWWKMLEARQSAEPLAQVS
jgi:non-ribosomal peptide synthetase component F